MITTFGSDIIRPGLAKINKRQSVLLQRPLFKHTCWWCVFLYSYWISFFSPPVHRAIHSPFRPRAPDLYLCPGMVSLGQPAASLDFPAGTAVPGYPIHAMHCPSVALTPGYVTSPSVTIHVRSCLAYEHVLLVLWGVLPLPTHFLPPPLPSPKELRKCCRFSIPWILGYMQLTSFSPLTGILCPVHLARAQRHQVAFALWSHAILHWQVELLICCNWSKLQSVPHSSMTPLHTAADCSHFLAIYSDRSYGVPFVSAVFVSNPYMETSQSNEVVFFFTWTSESYTISGKQV